MWSSARRFGVGVAVSFVCVGACALRIVLIVRFTCVVGAALPAVQKCADLKHILLYLVKNPCLFATLSWISSVVVCMHLG